jgi:N-acetylglucosamine kinase-like BadF-type ATPase
VSELAVLGLGIDAGGTATRWALLAADDTVIAQGEGGGLTGLLLHSKHGVQTLHEELARIAAAVAPARGDAAIQIVGGFTGTDGASPALAAIIAQAFSVNAGEVVLMSDVEVAYRAAFKPGEGYLVYAGTGSIAAFVDEGGVFHRAGGRGVGLDDGGGGYWMAREALRYVWRREDEQPGAWRDSALAQAVFARIGGGDWEHTRRFFYTRERGEIGQLAMAVRDTADTDPVSRDILRQAGCELARLASAMMYRFGPRPVALSGRAAMLHGLILDAMQQRLPGVRIAFAHTSAHVSAAKLALQITKVRP